MYVHYVRQFIPKPKWMLLDYKCTLVMSLENIVLPETTINCRNAQCTSHGPLNQRFHDDIITALLNAAKFPIPFTAPKSYNDKSQPGLSEHVAKYRKEAIHWHVLWIMCGCPMALYFI